MKRKYTKPVLAVESFQLDAAIAGSCSMGTPINHYENSCGFELKEPNYWQYFNLKSCEVNVIGEGGDGNDTLCYQAPDGMMFIWS